MNELDRIRKLAGLKPVLTEGVMAVPGVGQSAEVAFDEMFSGTDESAPPGMEDIVMHLKKEYPGHPEKAFATAWSIYNKNHGKTEDVAVIEDVDSLDISSAIESLEELLNNGTDPVQAIDSVVSMLQSDGYEEADIAQMLTAMNDHLANMDNDNDDEPMCSTCNGSGEGMYDGASCSSCGGSGVEKGERDYDDFDEPDEPEYDIYEEAEEEDKEEVDEAFDLNNGYDDIKFMNPGDFFPDGADSPVTSHTGPSGARMGDNSEQKKMEVAEAHKELVYNYRKFLKESAKK